jgi:hypothetical protein
VAEVVHSASEYNQRYGVLRKLFSKCHFFSKPFLVVRHFIESYSMTEKQIEHGYWLTDKAKDFPPESITYPSEYKGTQRASIACTQLVEFSPSEQKSLVKQWNQFLPTCQEIEMLWFPTQTPQDIFESTCMLKNLVGLNIKWSNIKTLTA